jgi:hypothetical protein
MGLEGTVPSSEPTKKMHVPLRPLQIQKRIYVLYNLLSRVSVTKTRVWIAESVYWIFARRNYN